MKALVLDLRDNPGGLLSTTEKISNYIMPPGTLVTVQNRAGKRMFISLMVLRCLFL